jgi:hypothetical protein
MIDRGQIVPSVAAPSHGFEARMYCRSGTNSTVAKIESKSFGKAETSRGVSQVGSKFQYGRAGDQCQNR